MASQEFKRGISYGKEAFSTCENPDTIDDVLFYFGYEDNSSEFREGFLDGWNSQKNGFDDYLKSTKIHNKNGK